MAHQPLIIAHRGESFDAPENTLAAFNLAWQRGSDAIELDIHLTADGHVVVCHDANTLRTAGERYAIAEHPLAVLRSLDVGRWKGADWAGQRMPLLAEVLKQMPPGKRVCVEIKSGIAAVPQLAEVLQQQARPTAEINLTSFSLDVMRAVHQALPAYASHWILGRQRYESDYASAAALIQAAGELGVAGIHLEDGPWFTVEFVAELHRAAMEIDGWTVDDPARCRELAATGVDAITTNRAAWIRSQIF